MADRDQVYLMPPSITDWLPDDHLAFFVLDVVDELDLSAFYGAYREDGRGGAVYDPALMLAVLFYAYAVGERSSRRIERRLRDDVGFRVIAANEAPDHATIARFRSRHQEAIAALFAQVLGLCVAEGLVETKVVAIDGTKMAADASELSNKTARQLAEQILAEAEEADRAEDEAYGQRRGDELPARLAPGSERKARIKEALRQLQEDQNAGKPTSGGKERQANVTDPDSRKLLCKGRYLQGYNAQAAVSDDQVIVSADVTNNASDATVLEPMVRSTLANLAEAKALAPETFLADTGYWATEAFNALASTADVVVPPPKSTKNDLAHQQVVLDAYVGGQIDVAEAARRLEVKPNRVYALARQSITPGSRYLWRRHMSEQLGTEEGRAIYRRRKISVEPVFGNIKANIGYRRFTRRGLAAVRSEWRLMCTAHNLLKLRQRRLAF
ncbi:MAG TPA: IS1182 family transposase [Stellaceae bacterium]|nr:IS1182 family transposase [Stellaceae bacterium]